MKTEPIVPARVEFAGDGPPGAPDFGDVYPQQAEALGQARHVFLGGNGLPARWQGHRRFVVLETGFGLGSNVLATWAAWREDPRRCERLVIVSLDLHPPTRDDLARAQAGSPLQALADELVAAWPPLTANLHALDFDAGRVRLILGFGDVRRLLPSLLMSVDAFYLDGFAPDRNPAMWDRSVLTAFGRLAGPGATAATWSVARPMREGLAAAGFDVTLQPGDERQREMTTAHFAPRFTPRRPPARLAPDTGTHGRHAIVVGAGMAGAFAASALAAAGWQCTVLERHTAPAAEASGNPGALVHGTAHDDDGPHARLLRAAAVLAQRRYRAMVAAGTVPGHFDGLLRLGATLPLGLPADYAHPDAAGRGVLYAGGGWVSPVGVVDTLLHHPSITLRTHTVASTAVHDAGLWQVEDNAGQGLASAPVLVIAAGRDSATLLAALGAEPAPQRVTRGQVTWFEHPSPPPRPVAGDGYAIGLRDGRLLCGATSQPDDDDPTLRDDDHAWNLQRLRSATGLAPVDGTPLDGRVGWRVQSPDRLPLVGQWPVPAAALPSGARRDHARLVPRVPGLFVLGALGSRGATWGPLLGEVLAAWIDGAPVPVEADLLDAVDPARWIVRAARRGA